MAIEEDVKAEEPKVAKPQVKKVKDINKLENQNNELKLYPATICQSKGPNKDDIKNNQEKGLCFFMG